MGLSMMIPNLSGHATAPVPSVDLWKYPGLTFAPAQHGEGVRFASNGRPVVEVLSVEVGRDARDQIDRLAREQGVSFSDACDALKYLRDHQML